MEPINETAVLAIGCNHAVKLDTLKYAEKNAISFYKKYSNKQSVDAFLIIGKKKLTKYLIEEKLNNISKLNYKQLIIYYSGHGLLEIKNNYLVRTIPIYSSNKTYDIETKLSSISIDEIIFIYDACCSVINNTNNFEYKLNTVNNKKTFCLSMPIGENTYENGLYKESIIYKRIKKLLFPPISTKKEILTHSLSSAFLPKPNKGEKGEYTNGLNFFFPISPNLKDLRTKFIKIIFIAIGIFSIISIISLKTVTLTTPKGPFNNDKTIINYGFLYKEKHTLNIQTINNYIFLFKHDFVNNLKQYLDYNNLIKLKYYYLHEKLNENFDESLLNLYIRKSG
ncbi:MAG: hypothetical protein K9L75_01825 [Spirochaetia bacterium]|nr:hypothetical protein [Spirochaetia bacterium]